jgi:hypothetical protein
MQLRATLDFEASGSNGYPIEVGVALYDAGRPTDISVWSSLIRLTDECKFSMSCITALRVLR